MYRPIMESNSPYGKNCESSVEKKCDRSGTVNLKEAFKGCPRVLCDQGLHVPYNTTVRNDKNCPQNYDLGLSSLPVNKWNSYQNTSFLNNNYNKNEAFLDKVLAQCCFGKSVASPVLFPLSLPALYF